MTEENPKDYSGFVEVLDTTDNFALNAAIGSLEEAEIPYVVDDEPSGVTSEVLAAKHKWWILACRILVPSDREEEARNLLVIFQHPTVPEIDADSSV